MHLRVVVSDNQSTDGTAAIVQGFLEDPRLVYSRSKRDLSIVESFQRAVELSDGEAFLALSADDVLLPGCLSALADELRRAESGTVMAGCGARVIDVDGKRLPLPIHPRLQGQVAGHQLRRAMLWTGLNLIRGPSTVLIQRRAFDQVGGFRAAAGYAGDLDRWLRQTEVGDAILSREERTL